jgi:hypothetical protein
MPTGAEVREAEKEVARIVETVSRERQARPMQMLNLTEADKKAVRDAVVALNPIARKLRELLSLYLSLAGPGHIAAVHRYLYLVRKGGATERSG